MNKRGIVVRALWALLLVGVMSGLLVVGVTAIFTDQATNPTNVFTTGTLDLAISPTTAMFTVNPMAPGDVVYRDLQVSNSGTLAQRYAMTTTQDGSSNLDEKLVLTITDGVGTTIYNGVLSAAVIGNPAQTYQTGDRSLAAGGSESLRYTVTLPLGTDNTYQGLTATVNFVFYAEQTANN